VIEGIFVVLDGAYAFSRQYTQSADPTLMAGLLTALRLSSREVARGEVRQAHLGESQLIFEALPGRPHDFVAVFATSTEQTSDLVRLARLIGEAFLQRYSEQIKTWTSTDGPFSDFQPTADQIVASGAWRSAGPHPPLALRITFTYNLSIPREPLRIGDEVTVTFQIRNDNTVPVIIEAIGNALPVPFLALRRLNRHLLLRGTIFLHRTSLPPKRTHDVTMVMEAKQPGRVQLAPILHGVHNALPFTILGAYRELEITS